MTVRGRVSSGLGPRVASTRRLSPRSPSRTVLRQNRQNSVRSISLASALRAGHTARCARQLSMSALGHLILDMDTVLSRPRTPATGDDVLPRPIGIVARRGSDATPDSGPCGLSSQLIIIYCMP